MKKNKEWKQIPLNGYRQPYDVLRGKVVKDIAFNNIGDSSEHQLIITFTDNTFIGIELRYDDDDRENVMDDFCFMDPEHINNGCLDVWVDGDEKMHLDRNFQQLVDIGLWDVDIKEVEKLRNERKKKEEEREYKEYLRLKEKFENE